MLRQSFSWWCFSDRGVPDETLIKNAKEIGYQGVELIPANLFDLALEAGLTIVSHSGHESISSGWNDPSQHRRIEDEIHSNLELAAKYQIPNLIVFSGERREGLSDAEGIAHCVAGLQRVTQAAEKAGVTLLLELLNSRVDHRGYQGDHTKWGAAVCAGVDSPRVKLLYDIYHMQIMEGDIIQTIRRHQRNIAHYHTAGVPNRHEIDETQELNYPAIVKAIQSTGYDGFLGQEFIPISHPLRALEKAYHICNE